MSMRRLGLAWILAVWLCAATPLAQGTGSSAASAPSRAFPGPILEVRVVDADAAGAQLKEELIA